MYSLSVNKYEEVDNKVIDEKQLAVWLETLVEFVFKKS
jgi:hypothetical protein